MDIELYSKLNNPIEAINLLGEIFANSGMFGCSRIEQGKLLAMACLVERKSPIQIAREYHIIDGKLTDRADAMLAKFRAGGGQYVVLCRSSEDAGIRLTKEDQTAEFRFSWAEAQQEKFPYAADGKTLKKNWSTPRSRMQMLWARVVSDAVRTMAPEVVSGIYTPEEVLDEVDDRKPAPALVFPTPKTEPKSEPKPEAIEVEVTHSPAPEPAPAPAHAPAPAPDYIAKIREIIGDQEQAALAWLRKNGGLSQDGSLSDVSAVTAKRIIARPDAFLRAIAGGAK